MQVIHMTITFFCPECLPLPSLSHPSSLLNEGKNTHTHTNTQIPSRYTPLGSNHENMCAFEAKLSSQKPFPTSQALPWAARASVLWKQLVTQFLPHQEVTSHRDAETGGAGWGRGGEVSTWEILQTKLLTDVCFPPCSFLSRTVQSYVHTPGRFPFPTPITSGKLTFFIWLETLILRGRRKHHNTLTGNSSFRGNRDLLPRRSNL